MRVERPDPLIPQSSKLTEPSLTERVSDINTTSVHVRYMYISGGRGLSTLAKHRIRIEFSMKS